MRIHNGGLFQFTEVCQGGGVIPLLREYGVSASQIRKRHELVASGMSWNSCYIHSLKHTLRNVQYSMGNKQ